MSDPTWDIAYTTDDASDPTPSWTAVSNSNVRAVSISRGRDDELGRVDAGTATLTLNNRTRLFDPQIVTGLRPMNRWRIRAVWSSVTYDVFLGYAESYEQSWPATGKDSVCVVRLVDEFKVLAMDSLPTMDPPVATYKDVILFDQPQGYWQCQSLEDFQTLPATIGPMALSSGTMTRVSSPILGDDTVDVVAGTYYGARSTTGQIGGITGFATTDMQAGWPGDPTGLSECTYEQWFKSSEATPAATRKIAIGPYDAGGLETWGIRLTTAGKIEGFVRNATPAFGIATGATSISANVWYHIAVVYNGSTVKVYLNGVEDGSVALTGALIDADPAGSHFYMALGLGSPGGTRYYDEVAWYRYAVPAARLLAHYEAGALRGFPIQSPEDRCTAVVAASTSNAAADFNSTIGREMTPRFMTGQSPLEELRIAEAAESGSAFLYITKDGTIRMLQDAYEGIAPYNAVQATFDDDGTDLPYIEATVDYSETFLWNTIEISRVGGTRVTDEDATSIASYMRRTLTIAALPIVDEGDVIAIAANLLARYKDPITRITSITVYLKTSALVAACLGRDLGDLIRVFRTPVGGGARIDQQLHIQSITLTAQRGRPWQMRFGLSP